ncbi:MAG: hypothetical protein IKX57_01325 [Oscillospiraceae bacterium]|nr:hypothetical protein [Oscillospiraceae bacterium]
MKPIDFMDALSDVNEKYVRQMVEAAEEPAAHRTVGSTGIRTAKPIRQETGFFSGKENGADKPFGGRMHYIALLASAAACIAGVGVIVHLYPTENEDSITADSEYSEVCETQFQTDIFQTTAYVPAEGTTAPVTHTTAADPEKTEPRMTGTEAAVTETGTQAAETTVQTPAGTEPTTAAKQTTAAPAETTGTTTAEPTVTTAYNLSVGEHQYVPFTQDALLGDVDGDGDITLLDYFWAAREYYIQQPSYRNSIALEDDAIDRGNVDRLVGDDSHMSADGRGPSPISKADIRYIRDIAVIREFGGLDNLTVSDYIAVDYSYERMHGETSCVLDGSLDLLRALFEPYADGYNGQRLGDKVPDPIREFYNEAHEIPDGQNNYSFLCWRNSIFVQKMDELRALLEET